MELLNFQILGLVLIYACCVFGDTVETTPYIKSLMEHRVTLPCTLTSPNKDWMFLRWKRTQGNEEINIAVMQNNILSPKWSPSAPANFIDHVELHDRIEDDKFSLSLVIDGFLCSDVGVYTCEVFTLSSSSSIQSNTTLEIEAHPGTPAITANTIEVRENDTFRIECNSDVGVPAHPISWLYTLAETPHIYQKVQEGIEQENTPSSDCKFNARSTLTLQMTSQLDRAKFICSTSTDVGEDGKPVKYDEVLIVLYGKTTTTESTAMPTTLKSMMTTGVNGAVFIPSSLSVILVCCLVTIFNLFCSRT